MALGRSPTAASTLPSRMRCPLCAADDTRVIDSRPSDGGAAIRRRRRCVTCGHRFTTYERAALTIFVRKRSGAVEPFEPFKVRRGMEHALADRPGSEGAIDQAVAVVEAAGAAQGGEISADEIGRIVLESLRQVDEVAYLRFASVYKEFQGARDFEREMAALEDG